MPIRKESPVSSEIKLSGRLLKAPENFLDPAGVRRVFTEAKAGRRGFIRSAFMAATAAGAAVMAPLAHATSNPVLQGEGDVNILTLVTANRPSSRSTCSAAKARG
jgi:sulfane dehydrogenase subunit SoxC